MWLVSIRFPFLELKKFTKIIFVDLKDQKTNGNVAFLINLEPNPNHCKKMPAASITKVLINQSMYILYAIANRNLKCVD